MVNLDWLRAEIDLRTDELTRARQMPKSRRTRVIWLQGYIEALNHCVIEAKRVRAAAKNSPVDHNAVMVAARLAAKQSRS